MLSPTPRRTTSVLTMAVGPHCLSTCSTRERGRTCPKTGTFGLAAHGHTTSQLLSAAHPLHYVLATNGVRLRRSDAYSLNRCRLTDEILEMLTVFSRPLLGNEQCSACWQSKWYAEHAGRCRRQGEVRCP